MASIILFLLILFVCYCLYIRNQIIVHFNATQRAWADVITFERQKIHTLDELRDMVSQYSEFEQHTLTKVTELRQTILNLKTDATDLNQLAMVETLSRELMRSLNVVVENYPELKANDIYMQMMTNIDEQHSNVSAGISIFNRNVEWFNNYIQIFPNNIINTMFTAKKAIRPFRDAQAQQSFSYKPNFNQYQ